MSSPYSEIYHSWDISYHNFSNIPAGIYSSKSHNGNTKSMCEICSKLTIKTPERHIDIVLMSLLLILNGFQTFADIAFHCWIWAIKYKQGLCRSSSSNLVYWIGTLKKLPKFEGESSKTTLRAVVVLYHKHSSHVLVYVQTPVVASYFSKTAGY